MKKLFFLLFASLVTISACGQKELKPWDKGGFDTHKYRSVFAEMGYSQKEIDAKLESIFQEVFYGFTPLVPSWAVPVRSWAPAPVWPLTAPLRP